MVALRRNSRLSGREAINEVMRRGRRASRGGLAVYISQSKSLNTRIAVIAPKKTDKRAVKRNKLRRQIGEIMRKIIPQMTKPLNIVIYVGAKASTFDFGHLEEVLTSLFKNFLKN